MFTSFQVILVYVPFMPFEFKPGDMVDKVMRKAKEGQQQSSGGNTGGSGGAQSRGSSAGAHGHSGSKAMGMVARAMLALAAAVAVAKQSWSEGLSAADWGASDDVG